MSNEFVVDAISFAKKSESLQGKIALSSLKRLRDDLASLEGEIEFRLHGGMDGRHRPRLMLSISGQVMLACQRCLAEMPYSLDVQSQLVLVANEAELPDLNDEDDSADVVVASGKMNISDLVEEEIMLALPLAPRHDFDCVEQRNVDDIAASRPFSVLSKRR